MVQAQCGGRGTLLNHYSGMSSTSWGGAGSSRVMGKFCSSLFMMGSTLCGGAAPPRGMDIICEKFTVMGQYFMGRCMPPCWVLGILLIYYSGTSFTSWVGAGPLRGTGNFCSSLFMMGSTLCGGAGPPRGTGNICESFIVMVQYFMDGCRPPVVDG